MAGIGNDGTPCACRNGTDVCAPAQTCLWFSVGCTIGCKECDGGDKGPSNPNKEDRCGSGMKATNNDPKSRTVNRAAEAGSNADWTKFNPWRAPGGSSVWLSDHLSVLVLRTSFSAYFLSPWLNMYGAGPSDEASCCLIVFGVRLRSCVRSVRPCEWLIQSHCRKGRVHRYEICQARGPRLAGFAQVRHRHRLGGRLYCGDDDKLPCRSWRRLPVRKPYDMIMYICPACI